MSRAYSAEEITALKANLHKKLDQLPQRDAIALSDATQWIDFVANMMPDEAMWHMVRAGGVGGSEIGVLARNYLGVRADHDASAHDWAMSKLLRSMPTPSTGVTRRGHVMEPILAQMLYEELGVQRDTVAFDTLARAQGKLPWMRYSPDEMIRLDGPVTILQGETPVELSGRILADYKAPTTVDESERINFQYSCQLHQGAILCEEQGIEISGAMLVQINWATWTLKKDFITIDPELCNLVREAGNFYWGEVMQGRVPRYVTRPRMDLEQALDNKVQDLASLVATIRAMSSCLTKANDKYSQELFEALRLKDVRFDGQSVVFPGALTISAPTEIDTDKVFETLPEDVYNQVQAKETNTKYDAAALVRRLKELGEDVSMYRVKTRIDSSKAFAALEEMGEDPETFIVEKPRITVSRQATAQADQWFEENFVRPQEQDNEQADEATNNLTQREAG